jgi:tetratricopeptide (TPR) repeat protein
MKSSVFPLVFLLLALPACAQRTVRYAIIAPSTAEAISLLGDTLWSLPMDAQGGPARIERLTRARTAIAKNPYGLQPQLELARSTAAIGRLRESVQLLTDAAGLYFTDPRIYRYRGELLLWLREADLAITDLQRAGRLAIGMAPFPEYLDSPDGPPGFTTMQYQTTLLLGVALYCKGDFPAARAALLDAVKWAITGDQLAEITLWLFFAVRRIGEGDEGAEVLASVRQGWATGSRRHEIDLLLAFTGAIASDTIRARALAAADDERALYSYGIGYYLMTAAGRQDEAEPWLEQARSIRNWTALPYLAAEADLARLRSRESGRKRDKPQIRPETGRGR